MMFDEFSQRCRAAFRTTSRDLWVLAEASDVAQRDNMAAQISQLMEIAASLSVSMKVNRATFLAGCTEYYDNAADEPLDTSVG